MVPQREKQHGQGVPLRLFEDGQEVGPVHKHQGAEVVDHPDEIKQRGHHASEDYHLYSEVPVHFRKEAVEGEGEQNQDHRSYQFAGNAETEEHFVSGNVVDRCGRVS